MPDATPSLVEVFTRTILDGFSFSEIGLEEAVPFPAEGCVDKAERECQGVHDLALNTFNQIVASGRRTPDQAAHLVAGETIRVLQDFTADFCEMLKMSNDVTPPMIRAFEELAMYLTLARQLSVSTKPDSEELCLLPAEEIVALANANKPAALQAYRAP